MNINQLQMVHLLKFQLVAATIKSKFDKMSLSVIALHVIPLRFIPCQLMFGVNSLKCFSIFANILCAGIVILHSPPLFKDVISF